VTLEEAVQARNRDRKADLGKFGPQFLKRDVSVGFPECEDIACAFLDAMRAHVTPLGFRFEVANIATLCMPPDRRRWRNAKAGRSSAATHPVINRGDHARTQVH